MRKYDDAKFEIIPYGSMRNGAIMKNCSDLDLTIVVDNTAIPHNVLL